MTLCWDAPLADGGHWPQALVPYWHHVLAWVEGPRQDALGAQDWQAAVALLDSLRDPTPEEATARWREFVATVWQLRARWLQRVARQRARVRA